MADTLSRSQKPPNEHSAHVHLEPDTPVERQIYLFHPAVFGGRDRLPKELACSAVFGQFPRYRFQATTSVWVKHHNASGCWPQVRQETAISSSSERVAMPYSRDFSAMLECN